MSHQPYIPENTDMREFTIRAILIGLVMTVILGAANAYLGLRAGMTIAATYPAAVIGMAVLRIMKGSILEENIARTVGSIGESVAAGAIFTIPAFLISGAWLKFNTVEAYLKSSALMFVGGLLGILFVTFLRRVMVTDPDLIFPESVAAAEIHKAGQKGSQGAKHLFQAMGLGAFFYALGVIQLFAASKDFIIKVGRIGTSFVRLGAAKDAPTIGTGGTVAVSGPGIYPAYIGVGYIIGPRLASLNFAGGVLAWGLFAPLLMYFLGPQLAERFYGPGAVMAAADWPDMVTNVWKFIIRPIAVGGMLVGAGYTLYRMRKNLAAGIKRSLGDVKKAAGQAETTSRLEKDLNIKAVLTGLVATFVLMIFVYKVFAGTWPPAILAAVVMAIAGFFFAAVSGNLVGTIGSSNNPISGLTLSTLIIAALLMVVVGATGMSGVAAVLGVAAVVCVSSAVAGEMLQDLKVGHILGGTPYKMQIGNIFGVLLSALVMYFPLMLLHGAFTFGSKELPAPQAGLMAALSQGIVGGEMAWPLVIVGMLMGFALILVQVKSPMLVAVGMYLPLETTFAIFVGGMIKGAADRLVVKRQLNEAQKARVSNVGILLAAGLIAGEALTGLLRAAWKFFFLQNVIAVDIPVIFKGGKYFGVVDIYIGGLVVLALIVLYLIRVPLKNAGAADEPPPPSAVI
ncbi:MAG: oligopeptide transporter, OPT family [Candidatus Aminicenantes bacterium RBG_19FT_COMBO_65_30]|nr:MAG: oligopeptide transporter, OPT family [Candidatus Aminicenantes bacterium RBG_19FT_COMBO_65_30]